MEPEARSAGVALPRVVVDTNVLIGGLLSTRGSASEIVDLWLAGEFTLLASEQMLSECERILGHPTLKEHLRLDVSPASDLMAMLRDQVQKVEAPVPALTKMVRNPFSEVVLASAIAGNARYLVTEEDELLTLEQFEGTQIVSPEQFVEALSRQPGLPGL